MKRGPRVVWRRKGRGLEWVCGIGLPPWPKPAADWRRWAVGPIFGPATLAAALVDTEQTRLTPDWPPNTLPLEPHVPLQCPCTVIPPPTEAPREH